MWTLTGTPIPSGDIEIAFAATTLMDSFESPFAVRILATPVRTFA